MTQARCPAGNILVTPTSRRLRSATNLRRWWHLLMSPPLLILLLLLPLLLLLLLLLLLPLRAAPGRAAAITTGTIPLAPALDVAGVALLVPPAVVATVRTIDSPFVSVSVVVGARSARSARRPAGGLCAEAWRVHFPVVAATNHPCIVAPSATAHNTAALRAASPPRAHLAGRICG